MRDRFWAAACTVGTVILAVLVVGFLFAWIARVMQLTGAAAPALANPGFEEGFTIREGPEIEVAVGWDYAYLSGDDRQCRAPCYRPEFKPEQQIVAQGRYSQRWFVTFARHFAAIHQQVEAAPGRWYEFACDVYAISEPDGQQAVFVGANPWGAGVFERTMVWGQQQPWADYRKWHRLTVTFQAWGNKVRVAVGSNNQWPTKNNATYVDNCSIREVEIGAQPTATVYPTHTPYPTPLPCPTCAPGGEGCSCEALRDIIREEIDRTTWGSLP